MTFPSIQIKATNLELSTGLSDLLHEKITALHKYIPERATRLTCDVEVEKLTTQQTGKIYRVEVNLMMGGDLYRAEATEEQVEKSVDRVRDELKQELQRVTGKRMTMKRRGSKMIKEMVQGERTPLTM